MMCISQFKKERRDRRLTCKTKMWNALCNYFLKQFWHPQNEKRFLFCSTEKAKEWMKKKKSTPFFGSLGGQSNSKSGLLTLRKDEGLQSSVCSGSETLSAAGAAGLHPCQQQGHPQHKICLNCAPQHCHQGFLLFHDLSGHWLGWTSAWVWVLGGVFSLSWKRIFYRPAQTCLLRLIFNTFRKGLQIAFYFFLAFTQSVLI